MTQDERNKYFRNCKTPQPHSHFGDYCYDADKDEDDADLTDDDPDEKRPAS